MPFKFCRAGVVHPIQSFEVLQWFGKKEGSEESTDTHLSPTFCFHADGPKDTSPEDTLEKTYVPTLKTLEEEVMEKLGIQEDRRHQKSYWY